MLQAKLRVVGGRHHGRIIPLSTKKFLIGREHDCHLRPNSELVSRHHCVIVVDDFSVRIRDLGSTNGTHVNDQQVRGEIVLNSGDRVRVGKLDFELVVGDPAALTADKGSGDSSQLLPGMRTDTATSETTPLAATDTSFEIPVPAGPQDTGSSIIAPETTTPVPATATPPSGDSTVVWSPPANPGYSPEMYPPMQMPYPQAPYQHNYPYMMPGMGYQPPPMSYPQMPMGYPGMYPQMGQMGMYPSAQGYMTQQPASVPEPVDPPEESESDDAMAIKLPDPKTTGAKAPAPPPEPPKSEAPPAGENQSGEEAKKPETKPPEKPSLKAADILRNYTQRRPI